MPPKQHRSSASSGNAVTAESEYEVPVALNTLHLFSKKSLFHPSVGNDIKIMNPVSALEDSFKAAAMARKRFVDSNAYVNCLRQVNIPKFYNLGKYLHERLSKLTTPLIKDRRYHLRLYPKCFKGSELIDWMLSQRHVSTRAEGVVVGSSLLMMGIIHHVADDHNFKDEPLFYRFRADDATNRGAEPGFHLAAYDALTFHGWVNVKQTDFIADRDYGLFTYKKCFVASKFIDLLMEYGMVEDRYEGLEFGVRLQYHGLIQHVTKAHEFKDEYLFFRFYFDTIDTPMEFSELRSFEEGLAYMGHLNPAIRERWEKQTSTHLPSLSTIEMAKLMNTKKSAMTPLSVLYSVSLSEGFRLSSDPRLVKTFSENEKSVRRVNVASSKLTAPWYHEGIAREAIESKFASSGSQDGLFLVRDYTLLSGYFVLSVRFDGIIYHLIIRTSKILGEDGELGSAYCLEDGPPFPNVHDLLEHYKKNDITALGSARKGSLYRLSAFVPK